VGRGNQWVGKQSRLLASSKVPGPLAHPETLRHSTTTKTPERWACRWTCAVMAPIVMWTVATACWLMLVQFCFANECQVQYPEAFIMGTSLSHCQVHEFRERLRNLAHGYWTHVDQLPEIHRYPPGVTYDG
jgi:hypothetical protein